MNNAAKVAIVLALVVVVGLVVALKRIPSQTSQVGHEEGRSGPVEALPRLVDVGSGSCIPCKMMAPILEELKEEYAGILKVDFFDISKDPDAGRVYNVTMIPTQIFFDAEGEELYRHVGFMSKEDILATWKDLGIELSPETGPQE